jgi:hypothetical protein
MFGKDQPDIKDEEDVGHFVASLVQGGSKELEDILNSRDEDDEEVAGGSEEFTTGTQSED